MSHREARARYDRACAAAGGAAQSAWAIAVTIGAVWWVSLAALWLIAGAGMSVAALMARHWVVFGDDGD